MKRLTVSAVRDLTFGRHNSRSFDGLDADFVVVHGPNESGKSTLAEFLTWAIGGPWRVFANNTEAFRGDSDGKLGGRLLGSLGADPIDLQASFKLLKLGLPNDNRTGFVGATEVDAEAFQTFLGGVAPSDYEMMYRCYGATLGDIGSGGSFENLFARFSMGGASSARNPREALKGLRDAATKAGSLVKSLSKDIIAIDREIADASTNPETVARLIAERQDISGRITELDAELAANLIRENLLSRVIDGQDLRANLNRARVTLAETPAVPESWVALVDNATEISDLVSRINTETRKVEIAQNEFLSAVATTGMDVTLIEGCSLTLPERLQITTATSKLLKAREQAADARIQLEHLDKQRMTAEEASTTQARTIGLDGVGLDRLDAIESQLPDLVGRAGRWLEDSNRVVATEAQLAGEVERLESAGGTPTQSGTTTGPNPKLVALAVLLVAGASFFHWGAAVVVALGAAAYFVFGRTGSSSSAKSDRLAGVEHNNLANLRGRAAEHRASAREHRQILDDGLGVLAKHVTSVDLAQKQLEQMIEMASRRRLVRDLSAQVAAMARQVAELEPAVAQAEREVSELLDPRGISLDLVNTAFETWFASYETATMAGATLANLISSLANLRERLSELTAPVAAEVAELTPSAIDARVDNAKSALSTRRAAEADVRQAEDRVRVADLDSPEVREILAVHSDTAELSVQREITRSRSADIQRERDELNVRRGEIRVEIDRLEGTEVLPTLLFRKGTLEDTKTEAMVRRDTLTQAQDLLGAAIDEHERDYQDPVVALASALVAEVVPDWGTVIKRRDDGGKLLIERVGSDGRIGDHAISDGGRALLYLAMRLAFAQQDASRRQIALPIICDDPLIHFDDVRQRAAVQLLKRVSTEHQVILFTCERDTRDHAVSLGASVVEL